MTTHNYGFQVIYGNGPPVGIAANNAFYIDTLTNILYISQNAAWLQLSGGGGAVGANPTATAGPTAINGAAVTYMRSDGAPAVQKGTNAQFGIVEVDGVTITSAAGVISAVGGSTTLTKGTTATSGFAVGDIIVNDAGNVINPVADVATGSVLVSGGVGAKPSYSNVPSVSSIVLNGGTALHAYTENTWVPLDDSGAGLVITNIRCTKTIIGRMCFVQMSIAYPATADGSTAAIKGFGAVPGSVYGSGVIIAAGGVTKTLFAVAVSGTSDVSFYDVTGVAQTNAQLSSTDLLGMFSFPLT